MEGEFEDVMKIVRFIGELYTERGADAGEVLDEIRDFAERYFDNVWFDTEYSSCLDGLGGDVTVMYVWNGEKAEKIEEAKELAREKGFKICLNCLGVDRHYYPF